MAYKPETWQERNEIDGSMGPHKRKGIAPAGRNHAGNSDAPDQWPPADFLTGEGAVHGRKHWAEQPTATTAHVGAPKELNSHAVPHGLVPERWEEGWRGKGSNEWEAPHPVYRSLLPAPSSFFDAKFDIFVV